MAELVWWEFILGAGVLGAVGQLLKRLNVAARVPAILKPFVVPVFGALASFVANEVGFIPDFSPIVGALMGTTASSGFDVLKRAGLAKGTSEIRRVRSAGGGSY